MFAASDRLEDLFEEAPQRLAGGDTEFVRRAVRQLAEFRPAEVDRHGAGVVLRAVQRVWQHGWQPAELVRHARRQSATLAGVCLAAIAADHAMRSPQSLAPEWARQIGELQLPEQEEPVGTGRWVSRWAEASGLDRSAQLLTIIELVAAILVLPPFDELIPPPGGWTSRANGAKRQADRQPDEGETQLLEKVRSLLAKAESSEFEAEAPSC